MAGSLHGSDVEDSSLYFGHFTDGVPWGKKQQHEEAFNLLQNPEKHLKK